MRWARPRRWASEYCGPVLVVGSRLRLAISFKESDNLEAIAGAEQYNFAPPLETLPQFFSTKKMMHSLISPKVPRAHRGKDCQRHHHLGIQSGLCTTKSTAMPCCLDLPSGRKLLPSQKGESSHVSRTGLISNRGKLVNLPNILKDNKICVASKLAKAYEGALPIITMSPS